MCKQGGRIRTFSHTLAKVFEEHFQTFEKLFPNFFNFVELLIKQ